MRAIGRSIDSTRPNALRNCAGLRRNGPETPGSLPSVVAVRDGRPIRREQHRPAAEIKVVSEANPKRAFPVKVTEFAPGERMVWSGGMPLGLFKGDRTFTLAADGAATRFTMREEYTGPLLPMVWRSMPDLGPSFEQFAQGLKARAEAS